MLKLYQKALILASFWFGLGGKVCFNRSKYHVGDDWGMIKRFEHVGIRVTNIERSLTFYQEVLGLQLRLRAPLNEEVELAFLSHPNQPDFEVELICRNNMPDKEGLVNHLAIRVEKMEDELARLKQLGVIIKDETPRTILNGVKIAFFEGPDGEVLELVERA